MEETHWMNARLMVMLGVNYPECRAGETLHLEKHNHWKTTREEKEVTCKECLEIMESLRPLFGKNGFSLDEF